MFQDLPFYWRLQETTINFAIFVTGVELISWYLIRPWYKLSLNVSIDFWPKLCHWVSTLQYTFIPLHCPLLPNCYRAVHEYVWHGLNGSFRLWEKSHNLSLFLNHLGFKKFFTYFFLILRNKKKSFHISREIQWPECGMFEEETSKNHEKIILAKKGEALIRNRLNLII